MAVRRNGYYNDPGIAAAFDNLAGVFAPPSGADLAGYATAAAKRAEASRLAELFRQSQDPSVTRESLDRTGIGSGAFNPSQSYYGVDQSNLTARRGQDISAATTIRTTDMNNRATMDRQLAQPVTLSQDQVAYTTPQQRAATGLPEQLSGNVSIKRDETIIRPDGSRLTGQQTPLSTDQQNVIDRNDLRTRGVLGDQQLAAIVFGNTPLQSVQTPTGPQLTTGPQAIGQTPAPTGQPQRVTNGEYEVNGQRRPAFQRPGEGGWRDAATGEPIPGARVVNLATPTGSNEQVGLGSGTRSNIDKQLLAVAQGEDTLFRYAELVNRPGTQGIAARIQGTLQNAIQTGGEVGAMLGQNNQAIQQAIRENRYTPDVVARLQFRADIPASEALRQMLIAQIAEATTNDAQVSNKDIERVEKQIGGGDFLSNNADTQARLSQVLQDLRARRAILQQGTTAGASTFRGQPDRRLPWEGAAAPAAPAPATTGAPAAPAAPQRLRFNPATGQIE